MGQGIKTMKYLALLFLMLNSCGPKLPSVEEQFRFAVETNCFLILKAQTRIEEFNQCVQALGSRARALEFKALKKQNDKE